MLQLLPKTNIKKELLKYSLFNKNSKTKKPTHKKRQLIKHLYYYFGVLLLFDKEPLIIASLINNLLYKYIPIIDPNESIKISVNWQLLPGTNN